MQDFAQLCPMIAIPVFVAEIFEIDFCYRTLKWINYITWETVAT